MKHLQRWGWPAMIVIGALLSQWMYNSGMLSPIRTLVTAGFILICPGMAYVRLLHLDEAYIRWMLAIALSAVIATIVGMVLVYSEQWSIDRVVSSVVGITLIGVLLDVATRRR